MYLDPNTHPWNSSGWKDRNWELLNNRDENSDNGSNERPQSVGDNKKLGNELKEGRY